MIPDSTAANTLDRQRLRESLRLCFRLEQAAALAERLAVDEPEPAHALAPVIRLARQNFTASRWLAVLRRGKQLDDAPPLRPRPGLPAVSALALALHLGLSLDIATLARLFHESPLEVATALQQARQYADAEHISPCPEYVAQVGRYRDPSNDRLQRLDLLQHLESCDRCRRALDHARRTDDALLGVIWQATQDEPTAATGNLTRYSLWLAPFGVWFSLLVLLILLVSGGIAASHRFLALSQTPVPLLAANAAPAPYTGWLLQTSESGDISAVNLATGARRQLVRGKPTPTGHATNYAALLSPDRRLIAQTSTDSDKPRQPSLRVYQLDGTLLNQWAPINQDGNSDVLGWLDANRVLISELPAENPGESSSQYQSRMATEGKLFALNVRSGERQVVATGWIADARVSPDGKYLALMRVNVNNVPQLEIDPFNGTTIDKSIASAPILSYQRVGPSFVWTPDSQRLIFATRPTGSPATTFDSLTLTGQTGAFYSLKNAGFTALVGLTPDGQHLIFVASQGEINGLPWAYLEVNIDGGEPHDLTSQASVSNLSANTLFNTPINIVNSPQGKQMLLSVEQSFAMPQSSTTSSGPNVASYVTLAFDAAGKSVGPVLTEFSDQSLVGWLSEEEIAPNPPPVAAASGPFHQLPYPVQGTDEGSQLTSDSQLSPDRTKVLLYDSIYDMSMSASLPSDASSPGPISSTLQTAGAPLEASWLPDSSGAIGVRQLTGNNGSRSRIGIYSNVSSVFAGSLVMTDFDPAGLGDNTSVAYQEPLLAPNGLHYSFFVTEKGSVALWIGGRDLKPRAVESWAVPENAKLGAPPIAVWINNDTLIFAETANWSGGLPQRVSLKRLTLVAGGTAQIDPLISWHARGAETGVMLQELRLSPDQSRVAFRLRHFTGSNAANDRLDAISVSSSTDLAQSIEIARGAAGDGMSWAPDGTSIVAAIKNGMEVLSADGLHVATAQSTDGTAAAYPVWVAPNDIWYEEMKQGKPAHVNELTR